MEHTPLAASIVVTAYIGVYSVIIGALRIRERRDLWKPTPGDRIQLLFIGALFAIAQFSNAMALVQGDVGVVVSIQRITTPLQILLAAVLLKENQAVVRSLVVALLMLFVSWCLILP